MKKKKVLLVDDVRLFLKLEETFFRRAGCEIFTAETGAAALELARRQLPDLILLDYIMPDLMGDEICKRLKSEPMTRAIPIMIVSTSADAGDIEKCFTAGADEYITKPINAQEILAKAANILNIPQRVHYRLPTTLRITGAASGQAFSGMSRNLSQGGLLVECREEIPLQATVDLELPILPGQGVIALQGQAVRVDRDLATQSFLVGVQFLGPTPDQEKALNHFIQQHKASHATV